MFKRISLLAISFSTFHAFAANSVAVIGQKIISAEEFKQRYEQNKALSLPGQAPSKEEVLSNIVNFELALQEAKNKGIDKDPTLKDQFEILMYKTLVQKEIKPKIDAINVPESDIKEYYEKSPLLRTRQIVFLTSPQMKNDEVQKVKARAQNAYELITTGKKNFVDMVAEFSEGPDAKYGGLVEWSGRNKLVPEYYEAALALKESGKISGVIESPYGFHIIQLDGIKAYSGLDTEYKNFIVRSIKEIKGRTVYEAYFSTLKKKYAVKTDLKSL
ncbi:MAG: peptidylprolyl isomerase [bacterium]